MGNHKTKRLELLLFLKAFHFHLSEKHQRLLSHIKVVVTPFYSNPNLLCCLFFLFGSLPLLLSKQIFFDLTGGANLGSRKLMANTRFAHNNSRFSLIRTAHRAYTYYCVDIFGMALHLPMLLKSLFAIVLFRLLWLTYYSLHRC